MNDILFPNIPPFTEMFPLDCLQFSRAMANLSSLIIFGAAFIAAVFTGAHAFIRPHLRYRRSELSTPDERIEDSLQ
ncbi:hypothetical protein V5799_029110 [Amblyomma americanum]|uniref:Uncharacterized protein n=1 Tax=Amblyomma americanum TaxID=6943 RepID=A0AAQ4ESC5_AMBAM